MKAGKLVAGILFLILGIALLTFGQPALITKTTLIVGLLLLGFSKSYNKKKGSAALPGVCAMLSALILLCDLEPSPAWFICLAVVAAYALYEHSRQSGDELLKQKWLQTILASLVCILLGLLKPVSGRVELYPAEGDSTPAAAPGPGTRCNFMYVPQGNSLMSGTVRGNLLLADPQADDARLKEVLHIAAADFVLSLPQGLDTPCAEIGGGLSEGQAQRIAIARALLRPGGILILDEATSALDAGTEERLLEMMAGRYKGLKTIICITHREAVSRLADVELAIPDILHK